MDVLSVGPGNIVTSSYDGSIRSINRIAEARVLLKQVNNLSSSRLIDEDTSNKIRRATMVAFVEIASTEAYSTSGDTTDLVDSRKLYREAIVDNMVNRIKSVTSSQEKIIHLVRGVTGSGKSTYARDLKKKLGADAIVETDQIKEILFNDFWNEGAGVSPEPRQLHKEASLICSRVVDKLCERGVGFILVQRFEKIEDAKRIVSISERYGYGWSVYSVTPDYVDIARNNITRSRSLLNINTFSPSSLQKSIIKYTETASYFYRLAALPCVLTMCDVRQQKQGMFSETYYKKDGVNIYVNSNPSIHSPLLSSRDSKEIEDYAIFTDNDILKYQNFFDRNKGNDVAFKTATLRAVRSISRSAKGDVSLANKDKLTSDAISALYELRSPNRLLRETIDFIYNKRFVDINSNDDLKAFILEVVRRTTGLDGQAALRANETGKYLMVGDIDSHFDEFIENLFDKMKTERNRIYVAAYILWSIDFTGHYFADGCSRVSMLIAQWYLTRTGSDMPDIERRLDNESSVRSSYRGRHHMARDDIYNKTVNEQKFRQFYKYYKSLFKKTSRPVIPCAGGYIFDQKGRILLLRSAKGKDMGKYVVPGGKIERGESPVSAFIREVFEETGISVQNISLIGKRRYIAPSGRRYVMYDFTAQAVDTNVNINNESIASEWILPIEIEPSECTASTINGLDEYLHITEVVDKSAKSRPGQLIYPVGHNHATGTLEKAYIEKKMLNYSWALEENISRVVLHGILPFSAAISSILPHIKDLKGKSGLTEKDRNSNALRPSSFLDYNNETLHLFNFPGDDILRHYALLFKKYGPTSSYDLDIIRYPEIDKNILRLTGLTSQIIRSGDIVYLGYSTRLKELLLVGDFIHLGTVENFWYISSRFKLGGSVLNVLECKFGHWGDISATLSYRLCELGAKTIIHNGKVGTLIDQSEVYSRVYIPNQFTVYSPSGEMSAIPIENALSSFIPFQSGNHISCSTPLDETVEFMNIANDHRAETVDIESSRIAESIAIYNEKHSRDIKFGAIHYASDYVGIPDDEFTSYNLSNEHDQNPQTWKNAVLEDIFNVITYTIAGIGRDEENFN